MSIVSFLELSPPLIVSISIYEVTNCQFTQAYIDFIRWFHEFSVTTNLQIFQEVEFVYLFLCKYP